MRIGIFGRKGRLGRALIEAGCVPLKANVTILDQIKQTLEEAGDLDCVVNCAAWTDVDAAEKKKNYDKVMAVNLRGPANIRRVFNGLFVQISTGYIFDGTSGPNKEEDLPGPLNIYGWSKFASEAAAQMRQPTLVVRTLDLFGPHDNGNSTDFVRQIRDILELGAEKFLPDNLYGTPTLTTHLAQALLKAVSGEMTGVIHIASDLTLSRFEWGRRIAEVFDLDPDLIKPTSEIIGVAPRPLKGGLNVDKAKGLGLPIYSPIDGLRALRELEQDDNR